MEYSIRKARLDDCHNIEKLIVLSARGLSTQDYTTEQIEGALQGAFGVDTQLIRDGTYFVVESNGGLIGCGGWSKRKTLFGSDKREVRDLTELNPKTDAARIRAFFVHPNWARRGIGRAILVKCESEAILGGFRSLELMATLPGIKLYSACGFIGSERVDYKLPSGLIIEFLQMKKELAAKTVIQTDPSAGRRE